MEDVQAYAGCTDRTMWQCKNKLYKTPIVSFSLALHTADAGSSYIQNALHTIARRLYNTDAFSKTPTLWTCLIDSNVNCYSIQNSGYEVQ